MKRAIQSPVVLIPTWFITIHFIGVLLSIILSQN
jgi:hypothetical protein